MPSSFCQQSLFLERKEEKVGKEAEKRPLFKTIMADPPWEERGGGQCKRGADRHYPLMPVKDIIKMADPLRRFLHPEGCHLYLWVTNNFLPFGLEVMKAWGFRYITTITWVKEGPPGLGQYFRGISEPCLFGVRGKIPYKVDEKGKRCQGMTAIVAPKGRHSEKPDLIYTVAEKVSYPPRLELFSRKKREGWLCWGNEFDADINLKL